MKPETANGAVLAPPRLVGLCSTLCKIGALFAEIAESDVREL
jgi:hypothetical protein